MADLLSNDEIVKTIDLKAPLSTVWKALTDSQQFGAWFRVHLNEPFIEGQESSGHITWPGMEHYKWKAKVTAIKPESYFAFQWHPYAIDTSIDYSSETPTLCEFRLEKVSEIETRLTVRESGFNQVPDFRRAIAFEKNSGGWEMQMKNIEAYLA